MKLIEDEKCPLLVFFGLVLSRYPRRRFFEEMLRDELPRRREMCLDIIWGKGEDGEEDCKRENWEIDPLLEGLYVGDHSCVEEDLIVL